MIRYIYILFIIVIYSCDNINIADTGIESEILKTKTKYLIDNSTKEISNALYIRHYNPKGEFIKLIEFNQSNSTRKTTTVKKNINVITETVITEDELGNPIKEIINEILIDDKGNPKRVYVFNSIGTKIKTINLEYDDNGNLTKEQTCFEDGQCGIETTYDIIYDKKTGQIKKITILDNKIIRSYDEINQNGFNELSRVTKDVNNITQKINKFIYGTNGEIEYHYILDANYNIELSYKYDYQYYQ